MTAALIMVGVLTQVGGYAHAMVPRSPRRSAPGSAPSFELAKVHRPTGAEAIAQILATVRKIPSGRVATYGQIAFLAGLPGHARQVGFALRGLPEGSAVPWHRVLNAQGEISSRDDPAWEGFQRHLLEEEGVAFGERGGCSRVDLDRFGWDLEARIRPAQLRKPRKG